MHSNFHRENSLANCTIRCALAANQVFLCILFIGPLTLLYASEENLKAESRWSVEDMRGTGVRRTQEFVLSRLSHRPVTEIKLLIPHGVLGARIEGTAAFDGDSLSQLQGNMVIEELTREGSELRRLELREQDGRIQRLFSVSGHEQSFEPQGRAFMTRIIPILLRESALNASDRVISILSQAGVQGVLAEIALIRRDLARAMYLRELSQLAVIDEPHLTQALDLVATIDADTERRVAITALLKQKTFAGSHAHQTLLLIAKLDSNLEKRVVLVQLVPQIAARTDVAEELSEVFRSFESDSEVRVAIAALGQQELLDPHNVTAAIKAVYQIESDHEAANALDALAGHLQDATAFSLYLEALDRIESGYERRRAVSTLIASVTLRRADMDTLLEAMKRVDSDSTCAYLLEELHRTQGTMLDARRPYLDAVARCKDITG